MSFFRKTEPLIVDTQLDIDQRISARAKRLSLKVNFMTGRVELVIPKRASQRMIERFLSDNRDWVLDKQASIPQKIAFLDGVTIPVCGKDVSIHITRDSSVRRTSISLRDSGLYVKTNLDDPSSRIQRYLKKHALNVFQNLAVEKATRINKEITQISIRDTKSCWGSCSHDGQISLSWRLLFAPYDAMDYVIAHEVAHLEHLNHSKNFWHVCEGLCLNYMQGKTWMKQNGHKLMMYGC